ncbi:MAG: redox-sensing transcriptional repressor Rex, partial [Clostridia bacterium]|nr:redox-sensing transcriptional repressor Rex [Clostridia bacterium]
LREGVLRISSLELAERMSVTASQIRQDLNCFGGFGQQGYGYHVKELYDEIGGLLGVNAAYGAVFVGLGHLGCSLAESALLERRGIKKLAIFEVNPSLIGKKVAGMKVCDAKDMVPFCQENKVDIAVLAVPKEAALSAAEQLAKAGVRGIWNFSDTELDLHIDGVLIENMHLADALMGLCYAMHTEDELMRLKAGEANE